MRNTQQSARAQSARAQSARTQSARTHWRLALLVTALGLPGLAHAQSAPAAAPEPAAADASTSDDASPIVVTGTLLRGVAPVGSQLIGVTSEQIKAVGAANTSDLIASIPQAGNFNTFVGVRGSSNFSLSVNRPTLRYLGNTSGSTNSTLLLVDGHRLPGMGILQTTPDLDAISASAIERVEIVTDGGSSTYGSDAVGGVVNLITRKSFNGIEAKANYGFGDNYKQANASIIAGKSWNGGSAYVAYDYAWHDEIFGADRDWSQSLDWINTAALGTPVGANLDCAVGNVQAAGSTYALPGLTRGIGNRCDASELATIYPRETKHSAFASLLFDNGGPISVSFKAYYVNRSNLSDAGPLSASGGVAVPSTSPFFMPIPGVTATTQTVIFNYSPVLGNSTPQRTSLESYGITPSVRIKLGGDWQFNALANVGRGDSRFIGGVFNPTPVSNAARLGTFNPFNLSAATNAATLATATDWFTFGRARNDLINVRAVVDGPLFKLPAGDVRVAFGAEYLTETYKGNNSRGITAAGIAALIDFTKDRTVKSVFGEINVPLLGGDAGIVHSLSATASGRYDDYSDFGHTFNPKFGINFEPVNWLKLRGNYSRAFQAPGLSDLALATSQTLNLLPTAVRPFTRPGLAPGSTNNNILVVLGGTQLPLNPQKAKTYSFGFDMKPPVIPGLAFGGTYYNIDFKGAIGFPPIFTPATFYAQFPNNFVTYDQGNAALQAYLNQLGAIATNTSTALAGLPNGINSVYAVIDDRTTNLARIKTSGIDFYTSYRTDTGFGAVYASVNGTYILTFANQANPNAPLLSQTARDLTRLRISTVFGADIGRLKSQITWNFSQGYATTPTAANLQQNRVGSYSLFNLFFQYSVPGDSALAKDLSFTLNIDNLLDKDPPLFRGARNSLFGVDNGFSIGRVVKLGVSKKF